MVKTVSKIGNSQGVMLDSALMELAHLKVGDQLNVTIHEGGSIMLTPVRRVIDSESAKRAAKRIISRNSELFRRLS
jgi:antitoxin component of MazEF toxin-antitoxin module